MSMTIEKAIADLNGYIGVFDDIYDYELKELWPALELAVVALREKAERENPTPLTIEELQQMIGEPVYVISPRRSRWYIVHSYHSPDVYGRCFMLTSYTSGKEHFLMTECGSVWKAYRHKPKEEPHG